MNWKFLSFVAVALVLLAATFFAGYAYKQHQVTAFAIQEELEQEQNVYSWTTALCSTNHACIDVTVVCNGTSIVSVQPASELVFHRPDWEDPRGGNPILCNRAEHKG